MRLKNVNKLGVSVHLDSQSGNSTSPARVRLGAYVASLSLFLFPPVFLPSFSQLVLRHKRHKGGGIYA